MFEKILGRILEWVWNYGINGDMCLCCLDLFDRFGDILFCLFFESRMCVNFIIGSVGWDIVYFI